MTNMTDHTRDRRGRQPAWRTRVSPVVLAIAKHMAGPIDSISTWFTLFYLSR